MDLSVKTSATPEHTLVRLLGEFDLYAREQVTDALLAAIELRRPILVDLSGVSFIDSTALGVLTASHKRAISNGCRLALIVDGAQQVTRALSITGLDRVFETRPPET